MRSVQADIHKSESGRVLFPRGPNMTRSTERIHEDPAGAVCV